MGSDCVKINEEARDELLNEVTGLTDEEINRKPSNDEWSIKQVLEHLYLFELEVIKSVQEELAKGEEVTIKERPIHLAVNRDSKVEAPSNVKPSESFATLEELERKLASSREKLQKFVNNTDKKLLEQKALPHPGFKKLSLAQWIEFIGWHEKRHILQIKEVKEKLAI